MRKASWACTQMLLLTMVFFNEAKPQTNFKILFAVTPTANSHMMDTRAELQLLVDYANLAYENSEIDIRMDLARIVKYDYDGIVDSSHIASNHYFQAHHPTEQMQEYSADLATLVVYDSTRAVCGYGGDSVTNSIDMNCNDSLSPLAHEVGHTFGASHDRYYGQINFLPLTGYRYGHYNKPATTNASERWRDIMAYECDTTPNTLARAHDSALGYPWWPCPIKHSVIPYFSNPNVSYHGDPTGIADSEDVARTHADNIGVISTRQVEQNYLYLSDTVRPEEIANPEAIDTMMIENYVVQGYGELNIRAGQNVKIQGLQIQSGGLMSIKVGSNVLLGKRAVRQSSKAESRSKLFALSTDPKLIHQGGSLYFLTSGLTGNVRIICFDTFGKRLFSYNLKDLEAQRRYNLDVSKPLPSGLLIFRIESGKNQFWSKITL